MEELLIQLQKERQKNDTTIHRNNSSARIPSLHKNKKLKNSLTSFTKVLHDYCEALSHLFHAGGEGEEKEEVKVEGERNGKTTITTARWLYNLCSTIPNNPLGTHSLTNTILHLCQDQYNNEMALQASLFDTLGESESAMSVLFEIVPKAEDIQRDVTLDKLHQIQNEMEGGGNSVATRTATTATVTATFIDPEQERLEFLRQDALEKAQFAAITKAEADTIKFSAPTTSSYNTKNNSTHSISNKESDKEVIKQAKQAAKAASKALNAAIEAGAIVDETALFKSGYDTSILAQEEVYSSMNQIALHKMNADEYRQFHSNLLPEGSRVHHEPKGLPSGTEREVCDGYEKVTIPAKILSPEQLHSRIIVGDVMSDTEGMAFAGTKSLNPMQSTVFEAAFHSNENLLICAPTGAGKTNCAMLTVVAHLRDKGIIFNKKDPYASYQHIGRDGGVNNGTSNVGEIGVSQVGRKIIYIAPMKALAQEIVEKFSSKLKVLKLVVKELTGDMQLTRAEADRADILVTTVSKESILLFIPILLFLYLFALCRLSLHYFL